VKNYDPSYKILKESRKIVENDREMEEYVRLVLVLEFHHTF